MIIAVLVLSSSLVYTLGPSANSACYFFVLESIVGKSWSKWSVISSIAISGFL